MKYSTILSLFAISANARALPGGGALAKRENVYGNKDAAEITESYLEKDAEELVEAVEEIEELQEIKEVVEYANELEEAEATQIEDTTAGSYAEGTVEASEIEVAGETEAAKPYEEGEEKPVDVYADPISEMPEVNEDTNDVEATVNQDYETTEEQTETVEEHKDGEDCDPEDEYEELVEEEEYLEPALEQEVENSEETVEGETDGDMYSEGHPKEDCPETGVEGGEESTEDDSYESVEDDPYENESSGDPLAQTNSAASLGTSMMAVAGFIMLF